MTQPAYRFVILAPPDVLPLKQSRITTSDDLCALHLASLQQLRGRAYLDEGAIRVSHLDDRGAYPMNGDENCWHFLLVDGREQTVGCARFLLHSPNVSYEQLQIAQSPLAKNIQWSLKLRHAIEAGLQNISNEQIRYAELGSWAIAEEYRNTKAALEVLLAPYLWGEMIGHCVCSCTAAVRSRSPSVLRRIGAQTLTYDGEPLPAYFDSQYGCLMETLTLDSRQAPQRFAPLLNEMRTQLTQSPILQASKKGDQQSIISYPPACNFGFRSSSLS